MARADFSNSGRRQHPVIRSRALQAMQNPGDRMGTLRADAMTHRLQIRMNEIHVGITEMITSLRLVSLTGEFLIQCFDFQKFR
jgi:hypothetical protein